MEITPDIVALQGVMISADNMHSFSKLSAKGGNEKKIEYIINCIQNFLEEKNYLMNSSLTENFVQEVRTLALFLILNGNLDVLSEMADVDEIENILWIIPQIPKYLICEIFWSLHFDKFVNEAISYCNPQLSHELASAFIVNIKYYSPQECLKKLKVLVEACYRAICRLHYYQFDKNTLSNLCKYNLSTFQKCVNWFSVPPRADKLEMLSKDNLYKYKGDCLYTMLEAVSECLDIYTGTHELCPHDVGMLYTYTHLKRTMLSEFSVRTCDSTNVIIMECLKNIHSALLDECQRLVMDISVDIFCAWSEFMENDKSMQQKVGELCYKVHNKMLSVSSVAEHPVVCMLQQISRKPANVYDLANMADTDTILEHLNNIDGSDKAIWLQALLNKRDLCQNETVVQYLSTNIKLLNEEQCSELYKSSIEYASSISENKVVFETLAVKAFQHCDNKTQYELMSERFSGNNFIDMIETEEFHILLTETFNKQIASAKTDITNLLTLFLQNPRLVYNKIFDVAIENIPQAEIMLMSVKIIESFSNHYYGSETHPCFITVIQKYLDRLDTDNKINNYICFIGELQSEDYLLSKKLMIQIVMPSLHKSLLNRNLSGVYIVIKLLTEAYLIDELVQYRAPMLALLAQVMNVARWRINTFECCAPEILELALRLQRSLINTYCNNIPDRECSWLKTRINNSHPLNMYYYRKLWNLPDANFAEIISGKHINSNTDIEQLATWLSKVLCSSIKDEWCNMWDSLTVFPRTTIFNVFHDAMSLLTITEGANRTDGSWECLLYCYRNFVYVIKNKFFVVPIRDHQVNAVIDKIAITANLIEEEKIEELATALLPLFAYMAQRKDDYSINIGQYLKNKLRHAKFRDTINQIFLNGTTETVTSR